MEHNGGGNDNCMGGGDEMIYRVSEIMFPDTDVIKTVRVTAFDDTGVRKWFCNIPAYMVFLDVEYPIQLGSPEEWRNVKFDVSKAWTSGTNYNSRVFSVRMCKRAVLMGLWLNVRKEARRITNEK